MGCCAEAEHEDFMGSVPDFEKMLVRTHHPVAPWIVVRANEKRAARLNLIRDFLSRLDYAGQDESLLAISCGTVFKYDASTAGKGRLAKQAAERMA